MDDRRPPLPGGQKPPRSPMPARRQKQQQAQVFDYGAGGHVHSGSQIVKARNKMVPRLDLKHARVPGSNFNDEPRVEIIEDDPVQGKSTGDLEYGRDALYTEEAGYGSVQPYYASYQQMEPVVVDDCMVQMSQSDHFSLPIHGIAAIKNNHLNTKQDKKSSIMNKLKHVGEKRQQLYEVGGAEKENGKERPEQRGEFRHSIAMSVLPDHLCQRNDQKDTLIHINQRNADQSSQATARKQKASVDSLFLYNRYEDQFIQLSSKVNDKSNKTTIKIGVSEDRRWVVEVQCTKCVDHISQSSNFLDEIFDQVNEEIIQKALKKDPNIDPDKIQAVLTVDDLHENLFKQNEKSMKKNQKRSKQDPNQFDEVENFFGAKCLQKLQPKNVKNKNQQYRIYRAWLESHRQFILSKASKYSYQSLAEFSLSQYQHLENFKIRLLDRQEHQEYFLNMKIPNSKLQSIQALIENKMFSPEALIDIKLDSVHISNYQPGQDMSLVVIFEVHVRFERRTHIYHDAFYCPGINIDEIKQQNRKLLSLNINMDGKTAQKQHRRRQSSFKGMLSGVTSYIGSKVTSARHNRQPSGFRFDGAQTVIQPAANAATDMPQTQGGSHQRRKSSIKIKPLNFAKLNKENQQFETNNDPISVELQWADEILSIYSFMEFIPINKSDPSIIAINNNVQDLVCTNRQLEVRFVRDDDRTPQRNRGQGICHPFDTINIRTCFMVQQNHQQDQYYLEVQNIKVDLRKAWKAGMMSKKKHKLEGQIDGQSALIDRSYCEKTLFTKLDYETEMGVLSDKDRLFDHQLACRTSPTDHSNLIFIALNSTYIFYTKILFMKLDESQLALQIDLYSLISAHEQPPTDPATGKAQLIVDDAQWTSDGQFVVFALRGAPSDSVGTLCVLPRLGVSLVRVFNPTRFNLSRNVQSFKGSIVQNSTGNPSFLGGGNMRTEDLMKRPQKFIQLVSSETVTTKLRQQQPARVHAQNFIEKKWRLELWESQDGQDYNMDQEGAGNCMHIFLSNPAQELAFQFSISHQLFQGDLMQIERLFNIQPGNKIDMAISGAPEYPASASVFQSVVGQKKTEKGKSQYSQMTKLKQIRERNELGFLRFCLTNKDVSQSSQLLMRVPEMLQQWLPLFQYQRIQEQYDKETQVLKDLQREERAQEKLKKQQEESSDSDSKEDEATKAAKEQEKKKKEMEAKNRSSNAGTKLGSMIFNGQQSFAGVGSILNGNIEGRYQILNKSNERYEPVKVVAALQKLLTMCRWADVSGSGSSSSSEGQPLGLLSLNFKQWLLTVVNDCFFFLMHKQEPLLAYYILKISENYFGSRNDPTDYYIQRMAGTGEYQQQVQMEVNQVLLNCPKSYDIVINSLRDPQGEMYSQSSIEHRVKNEINLVQDLMPILFPKNYYDIASTEHYPGLYGGMPARYQFGPLALHSAINVSTTMNFQFFSLKNLFQMQNILLIFYCMIQFRNYQAANFNILSLVIANFISQRQIDPTFLRDYQECLGILMTNYLKREKTTEYEMFLGSTSSNAKFNKVRLGWRDDTYQCFKRYLKMIQKQQLIQKIERLSFHPSQLPIPSKSKVQMVPPPFEASMTEQEDESIEKEATARKLRDEKRKEEWQELQRAIDCGQPCEKYQEHHSQVTWKNEILEHFDSLSTKLQTRIRKVVHEEHRAIQEEQLDEEDEEQFEVNLYNQNTERTTNTKAFNKERMSRIVYDDVIVFFRLLNQDPFDRKTRLEEHQALIALEKMLLILRKNTQEMVGYLHGVHRTSTKQIKATEPEKKPEPHGSVADQEDKENGTDVKDFLYHGKHEQEKAGTDGPTSKRQPQPSQKDQTELLQMQDSKYLLHRQLEVSVELVRVCVLGLQLKFCKKKGNVWKNNQVSLLSIEVNKLVSLENFQQMKEILKFPSRLFNCYFANNLTQQINFEQHFSSKLQQLNYRLNSALFMRNYLFYEQCALERNFLQCQFNNILFTTRKAGQQNAVRQHKWLHDAVTQLRLNLYFLQHDEDVKDVNSSRLPEKLSWPQYELFLRLKDFIEHHEGPAQAMDPADALPNHVDERWPASVPPMFLAVDDLLEQVQLVDHAAEYGPHKQKMLDVCNRFETNNTQLLQIYHECLQIQQDIVDEAEKSKDSAYLEEKLSQLYGIVPQPFAVSLQSRFVCSWLLEAQKLLKYAQANTFQQAIKQIKGQALSSCEETRIDRSRHQKGLKYLEELLGVELAKKEYLSCMFTKDGKKSATNAKITHKIVEKFLFIVEKIRFIVRQYEALLGEELVGARPRSTIQERLQNAPFCNVEYAGAAQHSEQVLQYNLDAQHHNFIITSVHCFNQMFQMLSYLLRVQQMFDDGKRRRDELLKNFKENREIKEDKQETIGQQVLLFKYLSCLADFGQATQEHLQKDEAKDLATRSFHTFTKGNQREEDDPQSSDLRAPQLLQMIQKKTLLNIMLLQLQLLIKDYQLELFDSSENINTISYSLLLSFDAKVIENEHIMCVQQRVLEIHNLIQKQEQTATENEQIQTGEPKGKHHHATRKKNMQHLMDSLFLFNNSKSAQSDGVAQEEKEGLQQHKKDIMRIKEECKDLIQRHLRNRKKEESGKVLVEENKEAPSAIKVAGKVEQNILQKYLQSNWLMKRLETRDGDIGQHGSDSESEEDEGERTCSKAFKMLSKMLIYENMAFCRQGSALVDLNPDIISKISRELVSKDLARGTKMMHQEVASLLLSLPYTSTSALTHVGGRPYLPRPTPLVQALTLQHRENEENYMDRFINGNNRLAQASRSNQLEMMNCGFDIGGFSRVYPRGCSTTFNAMQKNGFISSLFDNRASMITSSSAFNKLRPTDADGQKDDLEEAQAEPSSVAHDGDPATNISVRMHKLGRIRGQAANSGPNVEGEGQAPPNKERKADESERNTTKPNANLNAQEKVKLGDVNVSKISGEGRAAAGPVQAATGRRTLEVDEKKTPPLRFLYIRQPKPASKAQQQTAANPNTPQPVGTLTLGPNEKIKPLQLFHISRPDNLQMNPPPSASGKIAYVVLEDFRQVSPRTNISNLRKN